MPLLDRVAHKTIRILAAIGTTAVIGFNTAQHIFPTKTLESIHGFRSCNLPGERYKRLLSEVCSKMDIDSKQISLFYNNGFGTISGGCLYFPGPSVIGLPRNCQFKTVEDVHMAPILFEQKPINWNSGIGKALEDVLLISDEHVKFLMAHELSHIKDVHFVAFTLHATGFFYGTYKTGSYVGSFMKGSILRSILAQFMVWGIGFVIYRNSRMKLAHWSEYKADENAARLGLEYSIGGVECMRSRLKLNRVLRKMHDDEGKEIYSKLGDNLSSLSTHPKRTERLKILKQIKEEMDTSQEIVY